MLYVGLVISGSGMILYIVSAILLNYYLHKSELDVLKQSSARSGDSRKKQKGDKSKEVRIVVIENATPGWTALLGLPAIPLFLIGIAVIILSLVIKAF